MRFASRVLADPAHAVSLWRSLTGGKAVGCIPPLPVPEILHAAGLLPVPFDAPEIPESMRSRLDAWVVAPDVPRNPEPGEGKDRFLFPSAPPADLVQALDLLESLAEWAGTLSGRPVTEGALRKSIRAYRERRKLLSLLEEERGPRGKRFPAGGPAAELSRAGDYLPPETHSLLLARFLLPPSPAGRASPEGEGEKGDPLVRLARRMIAGTPDGGKKTVDREGSRR